MYKFVSLIAVALLLTVADVYAAQSSTLEGEYLEARSVSVYIGACHYGSEFVEGGKDATLVWNIHRGSWNNVSLDGLTVVAVVTAQNNLAIDAKTRRSVLYVDENTTPEQRQALTDVMAAKCGDILGEIVSVQVAPVTFARKDTQYDVRVGDVLNLSVSRYPCEHCTQPHQIWYKPLAPIETAIVGKSTAYSYKDTIFPVTWNLGIETNNVFAGRFAM
jgi:hypothetical protein